MYSQNTCGQRSDSSLFFNNFLQLNFKVLALIETSIFNSELLPNLPLADVVAI